jgi:hypothetical protein
MNGEVQLIVRSGSGEIQVYSQSNVATLGGVGSLRIVVPAFPNQSTIVGTSVTLKNSLGQTNIRICNSIQPDTPTPGLTRLNFNSGFSFDFRLSAGGYFDWGSETEAYLDLFENESISQNWKFQDLNNFTSQGAFSREFRIPYSYNNQQALGALFDVNAAGGLENYFHYKLPAEIRVDTLPIAAGYVRVRKVYKQQNRINEVEIAFYAETPDLVRNIGEKKLQDLGALTSLDETVEYNNVITPSADRIWTILDRGQLWSEGGEESTRSLTTASTPVFANDLTPALSWWYLFKNIVTEAGFELAAGTLETILTTYWMPWCNSQTLNTSSALNTYNFQAYPSASVGLNSFMTTIPFDTEVFDNNSNFNPATYTYTAPGGGLFTFRITAQFTNFTANPIDVIVSLSINGVTNFNEVFIGTIDNGSVIDTTVTVPLDTGWTVQVKALQTFAAGSGFVSINSGTATTFSMTAANLYYGQPITYNLNAPDMRQIDLVTDVIKMHNCAIVADRSIPNKIYIVPQNSYLGSGDTLDWTNKLDTSKDIVISSTVDLQKAKFQFTYTAGEDIIARPYRNVNRIYGDYEAIGYTVNPSTPPSDYVIGDQKVQLVTRSTPSGVINGSGYVMPLFYNDSLEFVAPGPRCLFEAGAVNVSMFDDSTSTVVTDAIPVLNNYSVVVASVDDEDLNWAPETPPHFINSNPYNNLFNKYWRTYMNSLYSPEGRIMEASFALDLKDIVSFKFSDKIWIQDSYWRILEVKDYKVGMYESTQVKLLKYLENQEDCNGVPSEQTANGEILFIDYNGDPIESNESCCTRYGFTWDEANAVCWGTITSERPSPPTTGTATNPAPRVIKAARRNLSITNSSITGTDVTIAEGNTNMLAVGEKLELTSNVRGSTLLGKNVYTNLPGIHVGGGYRDGDNTSIYYGWAQSGQFVLQKQFNILTSGTVIDLDIEGVAGQYINMPDDTLWSVVMNVTIKDALGASETSLHHFTLEKIGGLAIASAITTLSTIGAIGTHVFTFGIDTTTNVNEHRINVTVTGGTYPENFFITASIQYQQSKTT